MRVYVPAEYFVKARNPHSGRLEVSLEEVRRQAVSFIFTAGGIGPEILSRPATPYHTIPYHTTWAAVS